MQLEAELPPSFFPDEDLPPLGMRLDIFEVFLEDSVVDSSFDGFSLEVFADLTLSSLPCVLDLLPPPEAFGYEAVVDRLLLGAERADADVFADICLAVAVLPTLLHVDTATARLSSPYSDRSSSS